MDRHKIYLVGSGKQKRDAASAARELYTGNLFRKAFAVVEQLAERNEGDIYILSALYRVVNPDRVIHPYDVAMGDLTTDGRRVWGRNVADFLDEAYRNVGGLQALRPTILAGKPYVEAVRAGFVEHLGYNPPIHDPMQGMGIGQRLQFLTRELTSVL